MTWLHIGVDNKASHDNDKILNHYKLNYSLLITEYRE